MDSTQLEQIHRTLGWVPGASDEGSVGDLNEFPMTVVESARRLPRVLRHAFVAHYASADNREFVAGFIEDVVDQRQDVARWRRGRALVPDLSARELVGLELDDILRLLDPRPGEAMYRIKPYRDHWADHELLTGAPAVVRPHLTYRYLPSPGTRDLLLAFAELEPVADIKIATRRWTTAVLAAVAIRRGVSGIADPEDLLHACFPGVAPFSNHARVAARALLRERALLPDSQDEVPGFRGPDDWFRDDGET